MRNYFSPKELGLLVTLVLHLILVLYLATNSSRKRQPVHENHISLNFEEIPLEEEKAAERPKLKPLVPLEPITSRASNRSTESDNLDPEMSKDQLEPANKTDLDPELLEDLIDKYGAQLPKPKDLEVKEPIRKSTQKGIELVDPYTGESNIWYRLPGRMDRGIPNPIYLCEGGGKVTVSIIVDWQGNVTRAEIMKSKSVKQNHCLYEQALIAARASKFESYEYYKVNELGSITFLFKGQ